MWLARGATVLGAAILFGSLFASWFEGVPADQAFDPTRAVDADAWAWFDRFDVALVAAAGAVAALGVVQLLTKARWPWIGALQIAGVTGAAVLWVVIDPPASLEGAYFNRSLPKPGWTAYAAVRSEVDPEPLAGPYIALGGLSLIAAGSAAGVVRSVKSAAL